MLCNALNQFCYIFAIERQFASWPVHLWRAPLNTRYTETNTGGPPLLTFTTNAAINVLSPCCSCKTTTQ